jgi:hypothetical protein
MAAAKTEFRYEWIAAVLLVFLILCGCGSNKYSHVTRTGIQEFKSYQWTKADGLYRQDPVLEANVQFLTDHDLEQKGFVKKTENADLLIRISYAYDYDGSSNKLRTLNLTVSRADNNELVWRGTAMGDIRTDASTSDLKKALGGILANFPPK